MTSYKGIAAVALGVIALAACGSSSKSAQNATTTTSAVLATATTTTQSGPAPTRIATTPTTVAPATTSGLSNTSPAVSATFVSARTGYALEQNGNIAGTTDGGHTWHRVGRLPSVGPDETIRYIDAADGFAFARMSGPLRITHDNGATWTTVTTPFAAVADLAIARGMISVVAMNAPQPRVFSIWSTPVAHLVWKRDPLTLSVGAGPVPEEQIVLNGGRGWIVDQNRLVIAGARLTSNGSWAKWNPPCSGKNGPAFLSASTGADLVATCEEGLWGPPTHARTVYFSHDGGTTFSRHLAPEFGPVMSATAQSAAVAGSQSHIQHTTNDGATWTVAASVGSGAVTDLGFTSTTQGFDTTGGHMLMTHDAGATWSPVKLP